MTSTKLVFSADLKIVSKERLPKTSLKIKGLCKGVLHMSPQRRWKQRERVQGTSSTAENLEAQAKRTSTDSVMHEKDFTLKRSKIEVTFKNDLILFESIAEVVQ